MDKNNPHNGHRGRVREKILAGGLKGFQPHEILEFLLFHTVPQKDTNPMAHKLISVFGSLENVLEASAEELMEKGGLSFNSAVLISSLRDIFSTYEQSKSSKAPIKTTSAMIEFFNPFFVTETAEKFMVAFLDSGLRVKSIREYGRGQENGFRFNVKEIVRDALTFNSFCVAIAHNHPVSTALPSKEDVNATSDIKNQLEYFDIKLADHLVFGTDGVFSFASDECVCCFVSSFRGEK